MRDPDHGYGLSPEVNRRQFLIAAAAAASTWKASSQTGNALPALAIGADAPPEARPTSNIRTCSVPTIRRGAWPVLFTPFNEDRTINHAALDELLDFYVQGGVGGIFASCASSEVFEFGFDEMLENSRRIVRRVGGRVQVVAGVNIGATLEVQARNINRIRDTGVDAVVVFPSLLPSGDAIAEQLERLADLTDAPLGLYECQSPEYRLLTPRDVGIAAHTGRYCFMKDTSCSLEAVTEKVRAAAGTPLRVFPAHLRTTPACVDHGAAGHCGFVANICPELCRHLCTSGDLPVRNRTLRALAAAYDAMVINNYPFSGKYILHKRGLRMPLYSRQAPLESFTAEHRRALDAFLGRFDFATPADFPDVDLTKDPESNA